MQAFRHPEVRKDRAELDRQWRDLIAGVVRDGQSSGEIGPVDVETFAITFGGAARRPVVQVALDDPVVTADRAVAVAMRFAGSYLGFGSEPAPAGRGARRPARQVTA